MTTINKSTKKGQRYIGMYRRSNMYNIYDAYDRPSSEKVNACNDCFDMCQQEGGKGFKIISAGCQFFSVAWRVPEGLRVETYAKSYLIK